MKLTLIFDDYIDIRPGRLIDTDNDGRFRVLRVEHNPNGTTFIEAEDE